MFNRTINENTFPLGLVDKVWQKAKIVTGADPKVIRKDACGAWIKYHEYGQTNSQHGWEIDHIYPKEKGGSDLLENLQPLQWKNNRFKRDIYPYWQCKIKAA